MSEAITLAELLALVDTWLSSGVSVIAPVRVKEDLVLYRPLRKAADALFEGYIRPANSIKEFVFPRHEKLYRYRWEGKRIELEDVPLPTQPQVILAARPCDAAALAILDAVFNWDTADAFYNRRRELTTIVSLHCVESDEHCFCQAVGCGPRDTRGADVTLTWLNGTNGASIAAAESGGRSLLVERLSEKGRALFAGKTHACDAAAPRNDAPSSPVDIEAVKRFLTQDFESGVWASVNDRCLGCAACAYSCPTCHCFDIVDEGNAGGGVRARNWDACQFAQFTLHASGHNPRNNQAQRGRQRILHKFKIYEEKFGSTLCTGCGNCSRNCPVALGVLPVLKAIEREAGKESQ